MTARAPSLSSAPGPVLPRAIITIGLDARLRGRLAAMAGLQTLAIGMFAARCCGTSSLVGDLTVRLVNELGPHTAAIGRIEGVPVVADERLLGLLAVAGPTIVEVGLPFARHLAIDLERPEGWLDFLASPAARRPRWA